MLNDEWPCQVADWCACADPPPSLEQARAVVLTPFALPSEPDAEVGQLSFHLGFQLDCSKCSPPPV